MDFAPMKYVVKLKSASTAPIQGEGTWVVEAADRVEAMALMEQTISSWPKGATWTIIKPVGIQYQLDSKTKRDRGVLRIPAPSSLVN
jgi:hypothetical protein